MQFRPGKVIPRPLPPLEMPPPLNRLPAFSRLRAWSRRGGLCPGLALWRFITGSPTRTSLWAVRGGVTLLTSVPPQPTAVPGTQWGRS